MVRTNKVMDIPIKLHRRTGLIKISSWKEQGSLTASSSTYEVSSKFDFSTYTLLMKNLK